MSGITDPDQNNNRDTISFNYTSTDPDAAQNPRVYFKTPLTHDQIALLHTNMYLQTNILYKPTSSHYAAVPDDVIPVSNTLPPYGFYSGNIINWDPNGAWVETTGWVSTGSNDHLMGQVPDPGKSTASDGTVSYSNLDTFWTAISKPVLMVGQSAGISAQNNYLDFDDDRSQGVSSNPTRALRYNEVDFRYKVTKKAHSIDYSGLVITNAAYQGTKYGGLDAYTDTSSAEIINSDTPLIFDIGMDGRAVLFNTPAFVVWGHAGVSDTDTYANAFEFVQWESGSHRFSFGGYLKKDVVGDTSANSTSYHVGVGVDTNGNVTNYHRRTHQYGNLWGSLVWNNGGKNNGGLDICGGSNDTYGHCPISLTYGNQLTLINGFNTTENNAYITAKGDSGGAENIHFQTDGSIYLSGDTTKNNPLISMNGLGIAAASFNPTTKVTGGQGTLLLWNIIGGDAHTALINISPIGNNGFYWFIQTSGQPLNSPIAELDASSFHSHTDIIADGMIRGNLTGTTSNVTTSNATIFTTTGASIDTTDSARTTHGQGLVTTWNNDVVGDAATNFVNVAPTSTGSFKWFLAVGGKGAYGAGAAMQLDSGSLFTRVDLHVAKASHLDGDLYLGSFTHQTPIAYADLSAVTASKGTSAWCSDCYSTLNPNGASNKGIEVYGNGTQWTDSLGAVVGH